MLNNILNGYRPLITKLGVISLLAFCIFFVFTSLQAKEADKPSYVEIPSTLVCGETRLFLNGVRNAGEVPFGVGNSDDDENYIVTFWANFKTQTWTIAVTDKTQPNITCVMQTGNKLKFLAGKGIEA
jgi:hypothetical protein